METLPELDVVDQKSEYSMREHISQNKIDLYINLPFVSSSITTIPNCLLTLILQVQEPFPQAFELPQQRL